MTVKEQMPIVEFTLNKSGVKKGPKGDRGWILTSEEEFLNCAPQMVHEFNGPGPYRAEYKIDTWKDGSKHKYLIKKLWTGGDANGAAPKPAHNYKQSMAPEDALEARISLILAGWAQSGQLTMDAQEVCRAIETIRKGCGMSNTPGRQRRDDMNDRIPEDSWQKPESEDPADGMAEVPFR